MCVCVCVYMQMCMFVCVCVALLHVAVCINSVQCNPQNILYTGACQPHVTSIFPPASFKAQTLLVPIGMWLGVYDLLITGAHPGHSLTSVRMLCTKYGMSVV